MTCPKSVTFWVKSPKIVTVKSVTAGHTDWPWGVRAWVACATKNILSWFRKTYHFLWTTQYLDHSWQRISHHQRIFHPYCCCYYYYCYYYYCCCYCCCCCLSCYLHFSSNLKLISLMVLRSNELVCDVGGKLEARGSVSYNWTYFCSKIFILNS